MSDTIKLVVPVYWTNVKKTKKSTTHLLGMNWYRNAHYHSKNKAKVEISDVIKSQLKNTPPISGKYSIEYVYHYKSKVSDLMNVTALTSKILNDTLQDLGIVVNDNVQYCISELSFVGSHKKDNPHCEVTISPK